MKKVYNVSYDLNKSGKDYAGLHTELKKTGTYLHLLDSTWLIASIETAQQVWERLRSHIDNDDNILIAQVTRNNAGWLPQTSWTWINNNMPQTV